MATMAATRVGRACLYRRLPLSSPATVLEVLPAQSSIYRKLLFQRQALQKRSFSCSRVARQERRNPNQESFSSRLGKAWRETKIEWKPIPIGLGIGFLGFLQFLRIRNRESDAQDGEYGQDGKRIPKRQRIYPTGGGWQVQIMSTLPLKAISRIWGRFNEITIPYYFRVPGFKLYGWIFGVNFDEVGDPDLHNYPNLASFFYRELKPGLRPLDPNMQAILSPADAKVLQFGTIDNGEVEQVKGMTYSLDALLGKVAPTPPNTPISETPPDLSSQASKSPAENDPDAVRLHEDEEFASINGISYTLPNLFAGSSDPALEKLRAKDQSTTSKPGSEAAVTADLATTSQPWWSPFNFEPTKPTRLYYVVVYLAPGDYHRFHSPVSWVCNVRRHFAGELYSVSPYVQRTLPGLFTLNERVVLLGRWKYGFFSYTSVGATNVGSIKINFDAELRTNSLTTDTEADRQAAAAAERGEPYSGFSEANYSSASKILGGHALKRGEEMGGFQLGSSIVLVFEAPAGERSKSLDEGGLGGGENKGGWRWAVEQGQKVKVGQALGYVEDE